MRWQGRRESGNVEDRRGGGFGGGKLAAGGGFGVLAVIVIALLTGQDPSALLGGGGGGPPAQETEHEAALKRFVGVVLADTEDVWNAVFRQNGATYREPQLVLYRDGVRSGCGAADASVGPFYCPADGKVYLDLSFFEELRSRFGAPGDFAAAYVIAHEVGHHVQHLLGATERVARARGTEDQNRMSVRLELQADFYAGLWAHHAQRSKDILEQGDLEEALRAAAAIGDDRLQKSTRGTVRPDSFTHGTSEQRARWFRRGFETGDMRQGDTFSPAYEDL